MFRPNLENPANKEATQELNQTELARSEAYIDVSGFSPILIIKTIFDLSFVILLVHR